MAWDKEDTIVCGTWTEEELDCGVLRYGGLLMINDTDYLLINASGDRLIIDPTLWNKEVAETC